MSSFPHFLLVVFTLVSPACGFSSMTTPPPPPPPDSSSITRRSAIERFERVAISPLVAAVVVVTATATTIPPVVDASDVVDVVGGGTSTPGSISTSTPISASWSAIDGLNTLESSSSTGGGGVGKFVSFDDSAYRAMINDKSRTPQFEAAIISRLNDVDRTGGRGPSSQVVLDLGTGPYAHFAIIAARAGAGKVYAIEASRSACESARIAVRDAGYDDVVTIIEGYSTDVALPGNERADFVIAEIVGSVASEEGVVATITDAHKRLVKDPNDASSWIPRGVQTYASPASYSLHNLFLPPAFDWTKLDGSPVRFNCRDEGLQLLSDPIAVEDILFADMGRGGYGGAGGGGREVRSRITFVIDPKRVEENAKKFNDEYVRGRVPDASSLAITAANSVTGIALWPRLILDDDVTIDSRHHPDGGHRRSHWQTVLPIMSPIPVTVHGGDEIIVDFDFDLPYEVTSPPSYKIAGNVISSVARL
ncbi:hypothetical protein ACHAXA_005724 [Cyclostephanos tholiformis]|uniref:Uncharacterized protein n=1 Tax=Cyclostephanos tholiformis TaxID=382380 RepID=A0ABD3R8W2_9STRA